VRLYVDADITPRLARTLHAAGYDVVSAHDLGNAELSDSEQMAFAATDERTLLTCNARDFTPIFEDYWFAGTQHSGVVVSEQLEFGELLRRVTTLLNTVAAEEMLNSWKNLAEFADVAE
jgi:hypothetical protein